MGLSVTGYVVEAPRVGQGNSPFTATPNSVISDQAAFNAAYPSNESAPRTEYLVFVLTDGKLTAAVLGWTRNEVINRFDYEGQEGRFKPLPGAALIEVGVLASDSNTNRLTAPIPISTDLVTYPMRISVGSGSGTTFTVSLVANDAALNSPDPPSGTVQLSLESGDLGWAPADLVTYEGQDVRAQRQTFYKLDQSASIGAIDGVLLLNPLPATSQSPLVRIGFGEYLTAIEKATEGAFSANPTAGTVEWARNTGRLKFNSGDISSNSGRPVYYDGVLMSASLTVPTQTVGTVDSPGSVFPVPSEDSDLYFRVPGVVQFEQTQFVDTLTSGKAGVVQINRSTGVVKPSDADQATYAGETLQAVLPDVPIERGMSLRLFRSPVDLEGANPAVRDLAAFHESEGATLSDPIIAVPQVYLPAVPVDTLPLSVDVSQGTGSFTPGALPRLDVTSPPTGYGYVLDFENRQLLYARREENQVLGAPQDYGAVQLPNPLVFSSNLVLEVEDTAGGGTYTPLVLGTDALIEYPPGLVTLIATEGSFVLSGTAGSISGSTFTDASQDFTVPPVLAGDLLVITSGSAQGVYTVNTVAATTLGLEESYSGSETGVAYEIRRGQEILADRYFQEVLPLDPNTKVERINALGTTTNSPRLNINVSFASVSRFRFGETTFATTVSLVIDDGSFTAPASMTAGQVEISLDTGNLNFSQDDVLAAETVYWVKELDLGKDYKLQPDLGFIEFTERMLELEEVLVTYKTSDGTLVEERGTFLVRKEEVSHPTATSTMTFNPSGREAAETPAPRVFRGGRPQTSAQVTIDVATSTITFLPSTQVTDALPAGIPVDPVESVYIDYYLYQAFGGEKTLSVLQPPMLNVPVQITEGDTSFEMGGDRTSDFLANYLLKVDESQVYLIASSSYDSLTEKTTINIVAGSGDNQGFLDDFRNPSLAVTSGPTPLASYFQVEPGSFEATPRGSNTLRLSGDLTQTYTKGVVIYFDGGSTYTDLNLVDGSVYDKDTDRTEVTLASNGARQYSSTPGLLKRSVRAILGSPVAQANTARAPILSEPSPDSPIFQGSLYVVFRKAEGEIGTILTEGEDYTIDGSGLVVFTDPLGSDEELSILYSGNRLVEAGRRFRVSYTYGIGPDDSSNGLLDQVLTMDYVAYIPDSFFWRVETYTNFRGELAEQYEDEAKASVPSGGPVLENAPASRLYEQGVESEFFDERYLSNEDVVARATLKLYNDMVNYLEDALQHMDGRVVGDQDGRFLFDGNLDNPDRTSFDDVTNQIDDRFKISPAPYEVNFPPLSLVSVGTYQEVYKAAPTSRFYPTQRQLFSGVDYTGTPDTGEPIGAVGYENVTGLNGVEKRWPWAIVTETAEATATQLSVDYAQGDETLLRPPFSSGDTVTVYAPNRVSVLISAVAVVGVPNGTTIQLGTLGVIVPRGSAVVLDKSDTNYRDKYSVGWDLGLDSELGLLTYIDAGTFFTNNPPPTETMLDMVAGLPAAYTDPERFPALDGLTTDDDGNRALPPLNPYYESELGGSEHIGYLYREREALEGGGRLRDATQAPFLGVGDTTGTIITLTSPATFPAPAPQAGDLVRILDGNPANTANFRRIISATTSSVTVAGGDTYVSDTGFNFTVTVSNNLESGSGTVSPATRLTDGSATFQSNNVLPGHTVVLNDTERRQVTAVISETQLNITAASFTGAATYRVENPRSTFGGNNSIQDEVVDFLYGELGALSTNTPPGPYAQRNALGRYLDEAFSYTYVAYGGSVSGSTLTSGGAQFLDDAQAGDYIYVKTGANTGVYRIDSITSQTALEIEGTFPSAGAVTYWLAQTSLATQTALETVGEVMARIDDAIAETTTFLSLASTQIPVSGDAGAFALGWLTSDMTSRVSEINLRISALTTDVPLLEDILAATDRLYDKRYVWIDARINRENGIIVRKERAQESRSKNKSKTLKALTKLLTT